MLLNFSWLTFICDAYELGMIRRISNARRIAQNISNAPTSKTPNCLVDQMSLSSSIKKIQRGKRISKKLTRIKSLWSESKNNKLLKLTNTKNMKTN